MSCMKKSIKIEHFTQIEKGPEYHCHGIGPRFHNDCCSVVIIFQHFLLQPPPPKPSNMPGQIRIMTTIIIMIHHIQLFPHPKPRPKPLSSSAICLTPFRDNSRPIYKNLISHHYIVLAYGCFCYPNQITFVTRQKPQEVCPPVASSFDLSFTQWS